MLRLDYTFFINQLKINLAQKSFFFDTITNLKVLNFIKLLYKLGVVRRYLKVSSKKYRIFPNWVGNRSTLALIKFFQKKTPIKLSYKALKLLNLYTFSSYILLNTDNGLLTHNEALQRRKGGQLVCIIL